MARLITRFSRILTHPAFWMVVLAFGLADIALGRPGGGSSYSGGSSGGGSGGGDGGGDLGAILILIIRYPHIAIPVIALLILIKYLQKRNQPDEPISSSSVSSGFHVHRIMGLNHSIRAFQQTEDPNFSQTLFLDFAQHIYAQYHYWRSKKEFKNLAPYISADLMRETQEKNDPAPVDVTELVIGSVDIESLESNSQYHYFTLHFDANFTETRNGHSNRFMVKERWTFRRERGVTSKGPEDMGTLHCPNCGAGLELTPTGSCQYCGTVVTPGKQHWEVMSRVLLKREVSPALELGTYAQERGTDLPTVFDSSLESSYQQFVARHQIADANAYATQLRDDVVKRIFTELYAAWSERNWDRVRPLTTDFLFQSQRYWIQAYKKAGVINKLDDLTIQNVQLVKMESDKYFDSITVRIWAAVKDYVIEEKSGKVIGGNRNSLRHFSEYWTFIRSAQSNRMPLQYNPDQCPNCGAPVNLGQTGICQSCNTKVTTGQFDWVLSRITQDEVYHG